MQKHRHRRNYFIEDIVGLDIASSRPRASRRFLNEDHHTEKIRARQQRRASCSTTLRPAMQGRVAKLQGMNGGRARRGRLRPMTAWPLSSGHLCAHPLSLSLSLPFCRKLALARSLSLNPHRKHSGSHIYKGSLGIATLRIITAVTCEPLNLRSFFFS